MSKRSSEERQKIASVDDVMKIARNREKRFWLLSVTWAITMIVIAVFFGFYINQFTQSNKKIEFLGQRANSLTEDLQAAHNGIVELEGKLTRAIDEAKGASELALQAAKAADEAREMAGTAKKAADAVSEQLSVQIAGARDELGAEDLQAIYIRQIAWKTNDTVPSRPGTKFTELSFSVYVDEDKAKHSKEQILAHINKVVYILDNRWFKPAERERSRPSNGFLLKIKVWGTTKVVVELHLDSPKIVLTRQGHMNLGETTYFKSGAIVVPNL